MPPVVIEGLAGGWEGGEEHTVRFVWENEVSFLRRNGRPIRSRRDLRVLGLGVWRGGEVVDGGKKRMGRWDSCSWSQNRLQFELAGTWGGARRHAKTRQRGSLSINAQTRGMCWSLPYSGSGSLVCDTTHAWKPGWELPVGWEVSFDWFRSTLHLADSCHSLSSNHN